MPEVTLERQIACAKRELAMRRNVYPKWVSAGRLKQVAAAAEIAAMEAIVATLEGLQNSAAVVSTNELEFHHARQSIDPR